MNSKNQTCESLTSHVPLLVRFVAIALLVAGFPISFGMFSPQGVIQNESDVAPGQVAETTEAAGTDWPAWGRTGHGRRYAPSDQITPENSGNLEVAWIARTGPIITGDIAWHPGFYDFHLRAFHVATGDVLWEGRLPTGSQAKPLSSIGEDGRQYVVTSASGGRYNPTNWGDYKVAFALPG